MQRNIVTNEIPVSSFLSCEKDTEIILRKLFISSQPYSDILKRLLVIQAKDCLDKKYDVSEYTLKRLIDEQYIVMGPKLIIPEHEQVKAYLGIHFDNFSPTSNPEFRDCMIYFTIMTHDDFDNLGNYRRRPFKIIGYVDGLLNKTRLTGIGQLEFMGCSSKSAGPGWTVHALTYRAVHGTGEDEEQMSNE